VGNTKDKSPHSKIGLARYPRLVPKDAECAARLKKRTLTNLYNECPAWLDLAHKKLDATVAAAYGWPADLTDEQIPRWSPPASCSSRAAHTRMP